MPMDAGIPERWRRDAPLSRLTTWRIGGAAAFFSRPRDRQELEEDVAAAARHDLPVFAIGSGSNLLFPDAGYPGLLVHLPSGDPRTMEGHALPAAAGHAAPLLARCLAGASLSGTVRQLARLGWAGLEWAEGIPGTLGGAIVNNAGAFGGEISKILETAQVCAPPEPPQSWSAADLALAYRHSRLKGSEPTRWFILSGSLRLAPGNPGELAARMAEIRSQRRRSTPREPSCGSVFRNPPGGWAGKLIEEAGLKGMRVGNVQVSTRHANYMVNRGGATAREALELISLARERVHAAFGIELELEVQVVGAPTS